MTDQPQHPTASQPSQPESPWSPRPSPPGAHSFEGRHGAADPATDPHGIPALGSGQVFSPTTPTAAAPAAGKYDPLAFNRRRMLITAGVLVFAAAVGAGGVAFGYQQGKDGSDAYYQPRNAELSSQLAALQANQAKASADAAAVPDLAAIAAKHPGMDPIDPTATSLEVTYLATDPQAKIAAVYAFMTDLGFTGAVLDRMGKTRALDGTLTAQGRNCNVSWTYHPDDGLQMVFEAKTS